MKNRNNVKLILDIVMAVLFITFFNKNLISFKFHIISGLVFGVFILSHLILNRKWIINISKRLFDKSIKIRTKISYILSVILLISIISIIASGMLIMKSKTYDRVMFWKMLHFGASYLSLGLIGIHIGMYWNWVINMFKKTIKFKSNNISKSISTIIVLAILIFGSYTIYKENYFSKTYSCLKYVAEHIQPEDIESNGNYYGELEKPSFIQVATTYGSIISVFSIVAYYGDKRFKKSNSKKINTTENIA